MNVRDIILDKRENEVNSINEKAIKQEALRLGIEQEKDIKWLESFKKTLNLEMTPENVADTLHFNNCKIRLSACPHWIHNFYGDCVKIPKIVNDYIKELSNKFEVSLSLKPVYRDEWHGTGDDLVSTNKYVGLFLVAHI